MAVSKVILNGETLMDVTVDTVTSEKLLTGYQATKRDGTKIQGAYVPQSADLTSGSVNPGESSQHVTPPTGYDGFEYVDVSAVSSDYIGSNITQRDSSDLDVNGAVVSVPSGYYATAASTAIPNGAFRVYGQQIGLDIGTVNLDSSTGVITVSRASNTQTISGGIQTSGYLEAGATSTANFTIGSANKTYSLDTQSAEIIVPTESSQIATPSGKYTLGTVQVAAISSDYVGTAVPRKDADDLTVSGATITAPAGYYSSAVSATIPNGTIAIDSKTIDVPGSTISLDSSTGIITAYGRNASSTIRGYVTNSGYLEFNTQASNTLTINQADASYALPTQAGLTITPTESEQTAVASGKYTIGVVKVAAVPSDYVGSNVPTHDSSDLSVSGPVVSVPSGYYEQAASTTLPTGSVDVYPATFAIGIGTVTLNSATGVISINRDEKKCNPDVLVSSAGYLTAGRHVSTTSNVTISSDSATYTLPTVAAATITPIESSQVAVTSGKYTLGDITVAAISSNYVGSAVPQRSSSDLSTSGAVVSVPSGYYAAAASAEVQSGSVTVSTLTSTVTPTISLNSSTGLITATNNGSISVGAALTSGYVVSVTSGIVYSQGSQTLQLTTKAAATYTPSSTDQTIAADQYLIGVQTISGDTNFVAANIAEGVTIFGVTGTFSGGGTPMTYQEVWEAVCEGWGVNPVMTSAQIHTAVENGW